MVSGVLRLWSFRGVKRWSGRRWLETGPLPPGLSTAPLLSPTAASSTSDSQSPNLRPSERYAELVRKGSIRYDEHQHSIVVNQFDVLWAELPAYQAAMVTHSHDVKQWLLDWDAARDAVIKEKIESVAESKASFVQSKLASPLAHAIQGLSSEVNVDKLPKALGASSWVNWASTRTAEEDDVLVVYEEDIDARVGRLCPEPPTKPAGLYLYGSVGTGKSLCMDLFFASTQDRAEQRRRVHFNSFMVEVQARLHKYEQSDDGKRRAGRAHVAMQGSKTGHTMTRAAALVREKWDAQEAEKQKAQAAETPSGPQSARAPLLVDGVTIVGQSGDARPLPMVQGRDIHDPFSAIARELLGPAAEHGGLLCFDELQVNDPFNAVAVREIFLRLFELGVVIVTTSNRELGALNRWRSVAGDPTFRPLVDAMTRECHQISLDTGTDYRRVEQPRADTASTGYLIGETAGALDDVFATLRQQISVNVGTEAASAATQTNSEEYFTDAQISVLFGRTLTVPEGCWRGPSGSQRGVARFTFEELCGANLGSADYAALASQFSVVMVSTVPRMDFETRAYARRFITLVDELYNHRVRLICSADVEIDSLFDDVANLDISHDLENMAFETEVEGNKSRFDLTKEASVAASNRSMDNYTGEDEKFAFSRAASRLHEMQTEHYYQQQHLTDVGTELERNGPKLGDPKLQL